MSFGGPGIDGSQFLFDARAVEEQQTVEGLVLGGGADARERASFVRKASILSSVVRDLSFGSFRKAV